METSISTAGSGKSNSVAKLGIIRLDVFDAQVNSRYPCTSSGAVRLSQSSEITENALKGSNVTLQARY